MTCCYKTAGNHFRELTPISSRRDRFLLTQAERVCTRFITKSNLSFLSLSDSIIHQGTTEPGPTRTNPDQPGLNQKLITFD